MKLLDAIIITAIIIIGAYLFISGIIGTTW